MKHISRINIIQRDELHVDALAYDAMISQYYNYIIYIYPVGCTEVFDYFYT